MTCAAYLILAFGTAVSTTLVAVSWVLLFFLLLDFSFIWGEPPVRALVSRYAPASQATTLMSLSIMSISIANLTVGWLGRFYETLQPSRFWLLHAAIAAGGLLTALLLSPIIGRLLGKHDETVREPHLPHEPA
jgi:POT family proton-dependent oligopeptide transporter